MRLFLASSVLNIRDTGLFVIVNCRVTPGDMSLKTTSLVDFKEKKRKTQLGSIQLDSVSRSLPLHNMIKSYHEVICRMNKHSKHSVKHERQRRPRKSP